MINENLAKRGIRLDIGDPETLAALLIGGDRKKLERMINDI